jgi:PAS domain S-box-containing protein
MSRGPEPRAAGANSGRRGAGSSGRVRSARSRGPQVIALGALPGAVLAADRAGNVSYVNSEAARLAGSTPERLRGRPLGDLIAPIPPARRRAAAFADWLQALGPGDTAWAARLARPRGRSVRVRLQARALRGPRGRVRGLIVVIRRDEAAPGRERPVGAMASLLRRDAPFRAAFEGTAIGMALVSRTGRFLQVNESLCRITGYTRAELRQRNFQALTHPEHLAASLERRDQLLRGDSSEHWEKRYIHKAGHAIWVQLSVAPLRDAAGRIRYFLSGFQDITALKSIAENLRESEELFRSAFDASAIGIGLVSLEGRYLRVNTALCQFLGRTSAELLGTDISQFNEPEEYQTIVTRRRQMIEGTIPRFHSYEKRFLHSSGRVLWGQLTVALVRNAAGQPTYFCILVQDTTERRAAEQTLRESEQRLRSMVEGLPVLMDAFDERGLIVAWNRECERVSGYRAEEIINNPRAMELLYPDHAYRSAMLDDARKRRRRAYRGSEWTLRCKNGSTKTIAWNNVGATVSVPGWSEWGIGIDVTERRRLEIALQQASEYEQRRLGQEMHDGLGQELAALALLAHSLARSPNLRRRSLRPDLKRLAGIASKAVASGRAIAHGLAPLEDKAGGLLNALRELTSQPLSHLGGPAITLQEQCGAELKIPASTRSHLYRMAQEALNNAVRHARARSVSMQFVVDPQRVRLRISDDGRGIAARARRTAGMGMKTMQDRATAIGGTVTIRTRRGVGTRVVIECPNLASASKPVDYG